MAEDPNWYEFYLSLKTDGKTYFSADRLLMRRVKLYHRKLNLQVKKEQEHETVSLFGGSGDGGASRIG